MVLDDTPTKGYLMTAQITEYSCDASILRNKVVELICGNRIAVSLAQMEGLDALCESALKSTAEKHHPQVTKEAIQGEVEHHILEGFWEAPRNLKHKQRFIDDLYALLHGEPTWCKHMTLSKFGKWMIEEPHGCIHEIDDWDICPVRGCGAARP